MENTTRNVSPGKPALPKKRRDDVSPVEGSLLWDFSGVDADRHVASFVAGETVETGVVGIQAIIQTLFPCGFQRFFHQGFADAEAVNLQPIHFFFQGRNFPLKTG